MVKGVGLLIQLFVCLASLQRYDVVIIQNPPCLPALVAAVIMSLLNGSIIVIDWHNLGFAMFEERYGSRHILVRIAKILEQFMTKRAHLHVSILTRTHTIIPVTSPSHTTCLVSQAMKLRPISNTSVTPNSTDLCVSSHAILVT